MFFKWFRGFFPPLLSGSTTRHTFFIYVFPSRTDSAYKDIAALAEHHEALHNGKQPNEYVMSLSAEWFKPKFLDTFSGSLFNRFILKLIL